MYLAKWHSYSLARQCTDQRTWCVTRFDGSLMLVCITDKGCQLEGRKVIDREEMSWRERRDLWCVRRVSLSRALSEGL